MNDYVYNFLNIASHLILNPAVLKILPTPL